MHPESKEGERTKGRLLRKSTASLSLTSNALVIKSSRKMAALYGGKDVNQ